MTRNPSKLVVVGHGAAGLAAALSVAEQARSRGLDIDVTLLEKSSQADAGGNTRWSPSYIRLAAPDRVAPDFEEDMREASGGSADRSYFRKLAGHAVRTIGWLQSHGVEFVTPIYYLSAGPARIQPLGGGSAIVEKLLAAATSAGVKVRYQHEAKALVLGKGGRVSGIAVLSADGASITLDAGAVILASGGFQGNPAMMRAQFGAAAETIKLISPGTRFDTGDGIRMATDHGASVSGDWNGMHIEPIDPRSTGSAPVVLVYPYGIVVDQDGRRFMDEGSGLVHETWEAFARDIHFARPNSIAYAILDSRLFDIEGYQRAIRSEVPPYQSPLLEDLAAQIRVPARNLIETVEAFNAAATGNVGQFDATRCDGLATATELEPPKSNWARPITKPPFLAYPLVGGLAYTFGGLATNEKAEVLGAQAPMPGLYAAGETTGHFYGTAPNAVAVLRALVFGRIAGCEAVDFVAGLGENGQG
ncbi:MAG: FAD-binding protein [Bradyrhizobium sp.]|uniref:FAD-binding protein n=1 Tax=Bradyrhizobium sp. TaxID=376 RepID=UPI002726261C|nr:FAD-binding protein [Bradyrhizobium sp.]MDO8399753.1 FAD-binding protein [Bradyrhizobium sp.]